MIALLLAITINTTVPYNGISQDEAVKRLKVFVHEAENQYADNTGRREEWNGNVCEFSFLIGGEPVYGTIVVESSEVIISYNLPSSMPFKKDIEATVSEQIKKILACSPAYSISLCLYGGPGTRAGPFFIYT